MPCSSWYLIILGILMFVESTISLNHSSGLDKFYSSIETKSLSRWEADNLRLMLNFIRESPEFRPLTFSVVLPEFHSNIVDFLLNYVGQNSIEAYVVRDSDLSLRATWKDQIHLTWVVVIHDLPNLNIFIHWQRELWKSRNQYLIVFTSNRITVPWRKIFKNLWEEYNVYRVIVISTDDAFRCITRYMPFEILDDDFGNVHRLCLKRNSTAPLDDGRPKNNGQKALLLNYNSRLFENFRHLNRYPLNVTVFESLLMNVSYDSGNAVNLSKPDANALFTLQDAMGADFRIKATRKEEFKEDPFASSLREIESRTAAMIITGFFVKVYGDFKKFQFTCALYEDKMCFLAPDSGLVPKAYMPLLPFQKDLWALLLLYNIVITFFWCFLRYVNCSLKQGRAVRFKFSTAKPRHRNSQITNQLANHYSLITRVSTNKINLPITNISDLPKHSGASNPNPLNSPSTQGPPEIPRYVIRLFSFAEHLCYPLQTSDSPSQRALLFGTLFFGLIVNGLYQSYLVSSLSKPFHYPQIQTLEDVIESGKPIVTRYANLKNVFVGNSEIDKKILEKIQIVKTNNKRSTKDLVAYENKISISRYYSMALGHNGYYDKEGNPLIYIVDECPMNYRVSYILNLHSPYAERVDFVLLRFRESGLLSYWFESALLPIKTSKMRRKVEMEKRRVKLNLNHYSLTFLLLFVGLLSSAMIFFGEVYAAKRCAKGK